MCKSQKVKAIWWVKCGVNLIEIKSTVFDLTQIKWGPCIKIGDRKIDNFLLLGKLIKQSKKLMPYDL